MNLLSIIILAVIIVLLILAARYTFTHRGCGMCEGCSMRGKCSRKVRKAEMKALRERMAAKKIK
ncbi:MAG: hypothetical protein ACOX8B_05050 [Lachnospiraceae bacterium]